MAQAQASAGFTLIEILIALAIVAITTTIAVASYRGYLLRADRAEAVHALLAASAEQEKFHLANRRYSDRLDAVAGEQPPGLPVASVTPRGHYELAVEIASAAEFRVAATATGSNADPDCRRIFIDESGRRGAVDAQGADRTARCW